VPGAKQNQKQMFIAKAVGSTQQTDLAEVALSAGYSAIGRPAA